MIRSFEKIDNPKVSRRREKISLTLAGAFVVELPDVAAARPVLYLQAEGETEAIRQILAGGEEENVNGQRNLARFPLYKTS